MLTQERLKEVLDYCPENGIFTWRVTICNRAIAGSRAGGTTTGEDGKSYRAIRIDTKRYLEHRLAFLWMIGAFPKIQVDHEDGNGTNNTWKNLREANNQENSRNKRRFATNTTGYTGVTLDKKRRKYRAQIVVSGKMKNLGRFTNIEDAIAARKKAEAEHGFHANHGTDRPL